MSDIKVSISIITYKHANYIRQCLDSILCQKVNFKYEIVVGEDCSQDGTREILLEYQEKYPDVFVLLLNEKNMGVTKNSINVRHNCHGQYVAVCEGDDFWIDEYKLQKQVDFLDAHPEYVAVATNFVNVSHEGTDPWVNLFSWQVNRTYTLKDYLRFGFILHENSMMRRNVLPETDERYLHMRTKEPTMGDVITRVVLYDLGKIYALPDITLAHRDGKADATSYSATQMRKMLEHTKMFFRIVNNITEYYNGKYDLEALKANRMGDSLKSVLFGQKIDPAELKEVWNMLPVRLRLLSVERCVQKTVRWFVHGVARRLLKKRMQPPVLGQNRAE